MVFAEAMMVDLRLLHRAISGWYIVLCVVKKEILPRGRISCV